MSDDAPSSAPFWLAFLSLCEQATQDWLTGLHNRRYFEDSLADQVEIAQRYDRELSVVLFDIDNFKQTNDTAGHAAGDEVLKQFAEILKATARKADIVCRYGGDEFVALLPETGPENAKHFIERIDEVLATSPAKIRVTSGRAALPCENLLAKADQDLLNRKRRKNP
jgi:diguanylate cyclase (GGDEF)-like protein